jgi:hypothetical protein
MEFLGTQGLWENKMVMLFFTGPECSKPGGWCQKRNRGNRKLPRSNNPRKSLSGLERKRLM